MPDLLAHWVGTTLLVCAFIPTALQGQERPQHVERLVSLDPASVVAKANNAEDLVSQCYLHAGSSDSAGPDLQSATEIRGGAVA